MHSKLRKLTKKLLFEAEKAGADKADVIALGDFSISVDILSGSLEKAERSESTEIGLRVIINKKQACVSSSLLDDSSLKIAAERAVSIAKHGTEDPHVGLALENQIASTWNIEALELSENSVEPPIEYLERLALLAESSAKSVRGVSKVQSVTTFHRKKYLHVCATNGFSGGYIKTQNGLFCSAISGHGTQMERDGFGDVRVHRNDLITPEEIGLKAGKRAVKRANPQKPKTGFYPVLFHERISSSLINHLLTAIDGKTIALGNSWTKSLLGNPILPKKVSLLENPLKVRSLASRPFDIEGLPTNKRCIINKGNLEGWTLDLATSRQLGYKSTANAHRGVGSPPVPSITNIYLSGDNDSFCCLVKKLHTGLLVTSLIGLTINQNTGDYSRGVSGFWVENGEIQYPINECTIAGNLKEMLLSIIVGNDAKPHKSISIPSLLVGGMTIAGK